MPTTSAPTTTTTPLDALPPCPVDALDVADGPVEVLFWHGLTGETDTAIQALTAAYNASQSQVPVKLEPRAATTRRSTSTSSRARTAVPTW